MSSPHVTATSNGARDAPYIGGLALLLGVDLQMHWGTAFLWMLPLWLMTTTWGDRLATIGPRTVLVGIASAQVVLAIVFAVTR